ncbi:unnamed protein product [Pleuronectes platessa]|uniref:Uncharacterized protein n=1 Tax=Pleuronectes platessa TaxID=8262 RepID=A0A9N7YSS0_PLEPL|nr:unnamed protein product [Pleuronectes platessa]
MVHTSKHTHTSRNGLTRGRERKRRQQSLAGDGMTDEVDVSIKQRRGGGGRRRGAGHTSLMEEEETGYDGWASFIDGGAQRRRRRIGRWQKRKQGVFDGGKMERMVSPPRLTPVTAATPLGFFRITGQEVEPVATLKFEDQLTDWRQTIVQKQTKARLEIRLLKAKLGQAGLSTTDDADDDDEEGELIRRTTQNMN